MATIGDTGAPSTNTLYYDALLSTTLNAYRRTLYDNIFADSAFLAYIRQSGAITRQDGGERIQIPLMYGQNDTIATHGGYSVIDTTPQDGLTSAFYPWAEVAGTITISRKEERQNSGEARLLNLLQSKMDQAQMTMTEKLNGDLVQGTVSAGTFVPDTARDGSYGLLPLAFFLRALKATDPTAPTTVGNISSASYSWWRHRVGDMGGQSTTNADINTAYSTWVGLKVGLHSMFNFCSRGSGGSPDLVVADQFTFENYSNALDQSVRYQNTKMADMGFDTVKLRGATMLWDEKVPDVASGTTSLTYGTAFFINTKFYKLVIDSQTDIVTTPFIEADNQTVRTAKVLFMGNATCSNLRKMGVAIYLAKSITS